MIDTMKLSFDARDIHAQIDSLDAAALDELDFGVIGIDADTIVRRYNTLESKMAGLSMQRVVDQPLFTVVAPCMNNFMVAQRFEDAAASHAVLDTMIDYVLTLRMRPVKVKLRLLAAPDKALRYVLVNRPT